MNENIDLTKILKNCPKGTEFYSSLFEKVIFDSIAYDRIIIECVKLHKLVAFNQAGKYLIEESENNGTCFSSECLLFPSKDQREWSKFTAPWYKSNTSIVKEEKFNPKTLKPFDKVLVRDSCNYAWECDLFSHVSGIISDYRYRCLASCYRYCIPYNDDTKHLIGTFNLPSEYYIYWDIYKME